MDVVIFVRIDSEIMVNPFFFVDDIDVNWFQVYQINDCVYFWVGPYICVLAVVLVIYD